MCSPSAAAAAGNPAQQPTGTRVIKKHPDWMYKIPAGVREFAVVVPVLLVGGYLAYHYGDRVTPGYHDGDGRKLFERAPAAGTYRLEEIHDPSTGKVVAYRCVRRNSAAQQPPAT